MKFNRPQLLYLVIHDSFSQAWCNHLLQSLLFALCLSCQFCRAVTKPGYVVLENWDTKKDNWVQMLLCGYSNSNCFIKGCLSLCTNQAVTRGHMMSLFYLHVCYLVLFPVKALHLVLFQFLSGLHILVIVTLIMKIDLHCHPTGWHTYI